MNVITCYMRNHRAGHSKKYTRVSPLLKQFKLGDQYRYYAQHLPEKTWPIYREGVFVGVYDRRQREIHLFEHDDERGARAAAVRVGTLDTDEIRVLLGAEAHAQLVHDVMLLDEAGHPFSAAAVASGELTPVFFGSALTNFGVEPFLREFLELAPAPVIHRGRQPCI